MISSMASKEDQMGIGSRQVQVPCLARYLLEGGISVPQVVQTLLRQKKLILDLSAVLTAPLEENHDLKME